MKPDAYNVYMFVLEFVAAVAVELGPAELLIAGEGVVPLVTPETSAHLAKHTTKNVSNTLFYGRRKTIKNQQQYNRTMVE